MITESVFVTGARILPKLMSVVPRIERQAGCNSKTVLTAGRVYTRGIDWVNLGDEKTGQALYGQHGVLATLQACSTYNGEALERRNSLENLPDGSRQGAVRTSFNDSVDMLCYAAVRVLRSNHIAKNR